jgi:hypothetical protein
MMSTQRVESANHMLKTYVPRNSPMNHFVLQYNNLLFDRGVEEDRREHMTKQVKNMHPVDSSIRILRNVLNILSLLTTDEEVVAQNVAGAAACCKDLHKGSIKMLFSEEVNKVTHYRVMEIEKDRVYEVHHTNSERREAWSRVVFRIMVAENPSYFDCECGLYKHFGILCCHAIAVSF